MDDPWSDPVGLTEPVCARDGDRDDVVDTVSVSEPKEEIVATPEGLRVLARDSEGVVDGVTVLAAFVEPVMLWKLVRERDDEAVAHAEGERE